MTPVGQAWSHSGTTAMPVLCLSSRCAGLLIEPSTGTDTLKPVAPQRSTELLKPVHRAGSEAITPPEILDDLQPFLVVQPHALEDRLYMRRNRAALVVAHRTAGPIHQL